MSVTADPTKASSGVPAADERTPLLGAPDTAGGQALATTPPNPGNGKHGDPVNEEGQPISQETDQIDEDKPMPYTQIILLCFASIIEPVSYFAIFPIVSDMLKYTGGLLEEDLPVYSGIIEALFSVVQMAVMITYGKLADRIGRKPILVFSLFGIAGASALFGLSQNLWQMILLRAFTGLFAGSSVTIRAMLSELSTKKTQARAFSWYMFSRNMGIFVGPLIGGSLANPAENIPLFHDNTFFKQFPYSLSMFATSAVCVLAAVVTLTSVNETLQPKSKDDNGVVEPPMTIRELLGKPGVAIVVYLYAHVGFLALSFTAVNPVWSYEPVEYGGLGFSPKIIAIFVAFAGASQALWMLGPFPPLQQRWGTGGVFRFCANIWPFFFLIDPLLNELRRAQLDVPFWIVMSVYTFLGSSVSMAFACVQLCLNDVSPNAQTLGLLNSVALTINSGIRAVVPVLSTAVYEAGIKSRWIHGHLIWIILIILALGLVVGVRYLPENAEGRPQKKVVEEET
ncbi:hypothetical protein AMS68_004819 [Peltaster fructicola]|uniref:Major facilitator superfamily (MFS) profile domain-containing protein n=1 Tax=Peltaster fructicola TaxID=286661 RepID=A0A6H0XX02_9PEZI|nr:hypothetical protein AMS68_004819 [Peltaster fructicola]